MKKTLVTNQQRLTMRVKERLWIQVKFLTLQSRRRWSQRGKCLVSSQRPTLIQCYIIMSVQSEICIFHMTFLVKSSHRYLYSSFYNAGQTPSSKVPPGLDQENPLNTEETQKKQGPKAKTPAKRRRRKEIIPQTPPQHDSSAVSDTSELTSTGRPKRRAAKMYVLQLYAISPNPYSLHVVCKMYNHLH